MARLNAHGSIFGRMAYGILNTIKNIAVSEPVKQTPFIRALTRFRADKPVDQEIAPLLKDFELVSGVSKKSHILVADASFGGERTRLKASHGGVLREHAKEMTMQTALQIAILAKAKGSTEVKVTSKNVDHASMLAAAAQTVGLLVPDNRISIDFAHLNEAQELYSRLQNGQSIEPEKQKPSTTSKIPAKNADVVQKLPEKILAKLNKPPSEIISVIASPVPPPPLPPLPIESLKNANGTPVESPDTVICDCFNDSADLQQDQDILDLNNNEASRHRLEFLDETDADGIPSPLSGLEHLVSQQPALMLANNI